MVALARRHGRPVRWLEDRREALIAGTHGRGQTTRLALAADGVGRILALDAEIDADLGAYPHHGDFVPAMTAWVISGPYRIPRPHARQRGILTTAAPTASYRGAAARGRVALERAVDELARATGLTRSSCGGTSSRPTHPYQSPTGAVTTAGGRVRVAAGGRAGRVRGVAAGAAAQEGCRPARCWGSVASWIERSGGEGGSSEYARSRCWTTDRARPGRCSPQGQGHETPSPRCCRRGRRSCPRCGSGTATPGWSRGHRHAGSRSMQVGGSALHLAGTSVRAQRARGRRPRWVAGPRTSASPRAAASRPGTGDAVTLATLAASAPPQAEEIFAPPQAFPSAATSAWSRSIPTSAASGCCGWPPSTTAGSSSTPRSLRARFSARSCRASARRCTSRCATTRRASR